MISNVFVENKSTVFLSTHRRSNEYYSQSPKFIEVTVVVSRLIAIEFRLDRSKILIEFRSDRDHDYIANLLNPSGLPSSSLSSDRSHILIGSWPNFDRIVAKFWLDRGQLRPRSAQISIVIWLEFGDQSTMPRCGSDLIEIRRLTIVLIEVITHHAKILCILSYYTFRMIERRRTRRHEHALMRNTGYRTLYIRIYYTIKKCDKIICEWFCD